ncbi:cytotoxic T-lymphocyte protein 4-like isoform X2 [Alosa pseudoharengus]|uniref:cytotoxic T-lymphocyte protein 4-like isoform X2 n=1 Tax=Alosa pseudoharengus TaxID=34774 RepID=UPI003F89B587
MYNSLIIASLFYLATPAVNALRIVQPYRVVATDGQATVECRYASPPGYQPLELHVTLLKGLYGTVSICRGYVNSTIGSMQTQGTNACKVTLSERGVNVSVAGMKEDDTDMYRCVVKVLYPPPYLEKFGNGTLVYVPGERLLSDRTKQVPNTRSGSQSGDDGTNADPAREAERHPERDAGPGGDMGGAPTASGGGDWDSDSLRHDLPGQRD